MRIPPSARLAGAAAALVVTAAACSTGTSGYSTGSTGAPPPPSTGAASATAAATVAAHPGPLGTILVDGAGRTVYLFEKDTSTPSTCDGACAGAWPPLTGSGPPHAGTGATAGLLGTTARPDGATQLTYAGHPLYYYVGDGAAGDTHGQGLNQFGAGWYVLAPDGNKIDPG